MQRPVRGRPARLTAEPLLHLASTHRVRVLDSVWRALPATVLMLVTLFIASCALGYWADR